MPRDMMDRRVRRTRTRLMQVARATLDEGRWAEVSVQDLSDRADLARSSFYAHFTGKTALLDLLLDETLANAEAEIAALARRSDRLATVTWLAWHLRANRPVYRQILAPDAAPELRERLTRRVEALLAGELAATGAAPDPAALRFVTAGLLAVLSDWLASGDGALAADLEQRLAALALPVLRRPEAA